MTTTQDKKIPQGYKMTEVGVIPKDWEVKTLGDIGEIEMCKRIFSYQTKKNGLIPFYKIGTFGGNADAYISEELYHRYRQKFSFPKKGDILISASGTIGRTLIYDGKPSYFQDSNIVWIGNSEKLVSNKFLYYVLQIVNYSSEGSTIQRLYNNIIKNTKFILPPTTNEQKAIATVLSDMDELIEKLDKLIAKKKLIKQGTMQELLTGKKRLAGFSGEWEVKKLGEICGITAGQSKSKFIKKNGKYIIVDMGAISIDGKLIALKRTNLNTDFLRKGDLVMPKDDIGGGFIIGRTAYIPKNNTYIFGDHIFKLQCIFDNSLFLSYLINSYKVNNDIKKKVSGSAQLGLSKVSVEEQEVDIPVDKEEQKAIAQILSDMDNEIEKLEKKKEKYQQIKEGAMQVLLTGRVRLV